MQSSGARSWEARRSVTNMTSELRYAQSHVENVTVNELKSIYPNYTFVFGNVLE